MTDQYVPAFGSVSALFFTCCGTQVQDVLQAILVNDGATSYRLNRQQTHTTRLMRIPVGLI